MKDFSKRANLLISAVPVQTDKKELNQIKITLNFCTSDGKPWSHLPEFRIISKTTLADDRVVQYEIDCDGEFLQRQLENFCGDVFETMFYTYSEVGGPPQFEITTTNWMKCNLFSSRSNGVTSLGPFDVGLNYVKDSGKCSLYTKFANVKYSIGQIEKAELIP